MKYSHDLEYCLVLFLMRNNTTNNLNYFKNQTSSGKDKDSKTKCHEYTGEAMPTKQDVSDPTNRLEMF